MIDAQRSVRFFSAACTAALLVTPVAAQEQKFYPDDPLTAEPPPYPTVGPEGRELSEIMELVQNTVGSPGERHPANGVIAAGAVNTMGEVLDGEWFVNRHATRRRTPEELREGPGMDHPPDQDGPWQILSVKPHGIRPGILIADGRNQLYLLVFDSPGNLELASGAQMVSSRLLHAMGYHVPETYIVSFEREQFVFAEGAEIESTAGNTRALTETDLDEALRLVARTALGRYRAFAMYISPPEWQAFLGPTQVFATRSDDPNDIVPHEHRRDQRGLHVISSWINHSTMRAASTHDVLIELDGIPRIRHFMVDLWATLGSGYHEVKRMQEGNDPLFDGTAAFKNIIGFGFWSPAWMRAQYPGIPAVGSFESAAFDPETWTTTERLASFENRLPDDEFWSAKQVLAFTDEDIATAVSTGEYTDPEAETWITNALIERRDKIGRAYLNRLLPLDNFRVTNGTLVYDDLAERYGVSSGPRTYTARWLRLLNDTGALTRIEGAESFDLPRQVLEAAAGSYYAARIDTEGGDPELNVMVYLRTRAGGDADVVGLERGWPGKMLADPRRDEDTGVSRFANLTPEQQSLYEPYAVRDAEARGRMMTPEEHFDSQTISERTTFDAVTHALMNTELTDEAGTVLGTAFDILAGLERVAGQYYGRGGDQQFRLYVDLKPDAVETLERATQFHTGHENTVYHVGYPYSFRQDGDVPNMQVSVSEDGLKADIDVDYRSSKSPQALFNGHLTSANSDVRSGDNVDRHNGRWGGLIAWWQDVFGSLHDPAAGSDDFLSSAAVEVPTPLPPDRPVGAPIDKPEDAVQEFLTDWLVRQDIEQAMAFMSDRAYACVNIDDDAIEEALGTEGARRELESIMREGTSVLGGQHNLTEAIDRVLPWESDVELIPHAFEGEFAMDELTAENAAQYVCGQPVQQDRASYMGVTFRFKHDDGGVLGLLWTQENGQWKIVSYQVFEM